MTRGSAAAKTSRGTHPPPSRSAATVAGVCRARNFRRVLKLISKKSEQKKENASRSQHITGTHRKTHSSPQSSQQCYYTTCGAVANSGTLAALRARPEQVRNRRELSRNCREHCAGAHRSHRSSRRTSNTSNYTAEHTGAKNGTF